ncbi:hypothetical protein SDC9_81706 [bioreactor metagenome]|uniref:Uncharacterized protein n=1 Tax=bioreactor metagenome TaxID=1076179 RepID=A0A644Z2N7_9ZZZZ
MKACSISPLSGQWSARTEKGNKGKAPPRTPWRCSFRSRWPCAIPTLKKKPTWGLSIPEDARPVSGKVSSGVFLPKKPKEAALQYTGCPRQLKPLSKTYPRRGRSLLRSCFSSTKGNRIPSVFRSRAPRNSEYRINLPGSASGPEKPARSKGMKKRFRCLPLVSA